MSKGLKIGYRRISSASQNLDRQLQGMELDKIFDDVVSGGTLVRPQLDALIAFVREGDTVYVHSLDRLARSVRDLHTVVDVLHKKGVGVHFGLENISYVPNSQDLMAQTILNILGSFAEFERTIAKQRQAEGIAVAKAKGVYKGRSKSLNAEQVEELQELVIQGISKAEVARRLKVSRHTVYRYLEELK